MRIRDLVRLPIRFKSDTSRTAANTSLSPPTCGTIDLHMDGSGDDDDDYEDRSRTAVYDPNYVPKGGWDTWNEWAISQGKIARIIQSLSKNAMSCKLVSNDEAIQKEADAMARKVHLTTELIQFYFDRIGRRRGIMEPVWALDAVGRRKDIAKINLLYPPSVKVFRDNDADVRELKEYLKVSKIPKHVAYGWGLTVGSGFNIIGFVQNFNLWNKSNILGVDEDQTVFFFPDELVFIPRYPSPLNPDGLSIPQQNYVIIMNKLGIERDQAIMARRHGDPKHKFTIPANEWHKKDEVIKTFKKGIRAGLDFFVKGRAAPTDPDPMNVDIVEPKGNPIAVFKAQEHIEDQFIAAMGFADSFTESGSSNRSVGEIQLQFFERELAPERKLIAEILEDKLINPWLKAKGFPEGSVWFEFEDLTPDDRIAKATLVSPLIPYLPASVLIRFLDDLGYPLSEEEKKALKTPAPADPTTPKTPADPQQPAGKEPTQNGLISGWQGWKNEIVAPGCHVRKLRFFDKELVNDTGIPLTVEQLRYLELASQVGIPKPVIQTAKPASDQMKKEIEDMRDDIVNTLGL